MSWGSQIAYTVELGFGSGPYAASPSWTDISAFVLATTVDRGRSASLGRFEAGFASLVLENEDGRFDPNNSSSPYNPDVKISVPIRIQAVHSAATFDVFRGVVKSIPPALDDKGMNSMVTLDCVDDFQTLALARLPVKTYTATDVKTRIGEVLDDIGWPAGRRDLDIALARVQAFDATTDVSALAHLQNIAAGEAGVLWMSGSGDVTFRNRVNYSGLSSSATFGPLSSDSDYAEIIPAYDDKFLWNDVRVTRTGGVEQTAADATADTNHGTRTLPILTENENDNEALNTAEWVLAQFKDVVVRVDGLVVKPVGDPADLWPIVLGVDFDKAWTVKIDPPGSGTELDQLVAVQGIQHTITPGEWVSTFKTRRLAPVESATYFVLDTDVLDGPAVLA